MSHAIIYVRYLYSVKGTSGMEVLAGGPFRNTYQGHEARIIENNKAGDRYWTWMEVRPGDYDYPEDPTKVVS